MVISRLLPSVTQRTGGQPTDVRVSKSAFSGYDPAGVRAPRPTGAALVLASLGMATMGFTRARLAAITISDLLFVASAAVIVADLLGRRHRELAAPAMRRSPPLLLIGSSVLLTAGAVSTFASWNPLGSFQVLLRLAWVTFIWFWILRTTARDRYALYWLLSGFRIAVLISAIFAVLGDIGVYSGGTLSDNGRQMAFSQHPNQLGGLLVIGLPLFVFDVPRRAHTRAPVVRRLALTGLIVYGITVTGSIVSSVTVLTSLAAAAFILVAAKVPWHRRRETPLVAIIVVAVASVGLVAISSSDLPAVQRFTDVVLKDDDGTINIRAERNRAAIDNLDNTLLVGTGLQLQGASDVFTLGSAGPSGDPGVVSGIHNAYLKMAHEGGAPAFVGLVTLVLAALYLAWRLAINTRHTELFPVSVALFTSIVAANSYANFNPIMYDRTYWVAVGLVTCLWSVRRQELREATPAYAVPHQVNRVSTRTAGGSGG